LPSTSEDELQVALSSQALADQVVALALLAFSADELDAMKAEQRTLLNVLLKRRILQAGAEPDVGDCLLVRQQFELFCENRFSDPATARIVKQLRK
jgi:hypothetical protein